MVPPGGGTEKLTNLRMPVCRKKIAAKLQRFSEHPVAIWRQFGIHSECNLMSQSFLPICVGSRSWYLTVFLSRFFVRNDCHQLLVEA